jgi:NADPH2:quinone reductase
MKAIRVQQFGEPDVMQPEEVPTPQPGPGQVLVRIKAAGVNPVDAYIRAGTYGQRPLSYTPGIDGAGIIEAVGSNVKMRRVGERVYLAGSVTGTYAEQAVCEEGQVQPLPDRVSFPQGAAVFIPYATAFRAIHQLAAARAGELVLIHGASGGVGTAAIQVARAAGLVVIGTAGSEKGKMLVSKEGAHHVVDHAAPGYEEQIMELTGRRGVDVILEMLANVNLGKDLTLASKGGRIIVIGCRGNVEINPRDAMIREARIIGMVLFNASLDEMASIHTGLVAGLENGTLRPVVGLEMPLAEAPRAHRVVMEPGSYGKIVLVP